MKPEELGKKLGIGVRVAGRIAGQRAAQAAAAQKAGTSPAAPLLEELRQSKAEVKSEMRAEGHRISRAAGRGIGGFLRPFGRVGGILWLEVTGFFFGLIALYFAQDLWRIRQSYATGPQHQHFLVDAGAVVLFAYFCVSAYWRAGRK
jgi:hypothetical protein